MEICYNEERRLIRQHKELLDLIRFNKGIDRSSLSRKLNLSMPTIYKAIDEMSTFGLLNKVETNVEINEQYGVLVGISIGSSLCKIVFLDYGYKKIDKNEFETYKNILCEVLSQKEYLKKDDSLDKSDENEYIVFKTPGKFSEVKEALDCIFECIKFFIEEKKLNILSVGVSCTGMINNRKQIIMAAHNLPYLDNENIESLIYPDKKLFLEKHNIGLSLVQNSDAAVICEKIYLNHNNFEFRNKKNIISLYLGVGIGAGIYFNGLYSGTNGYAGEIGHTRAPNIESVKVAESEQGFDETTCTCGNNDCYDFKIRKCVFGMSRDKFAELNSQQILENLEKNIENRKLFGQYLGHMVNMLTNLLNIDLIIFSGKFYKCMDLLMKDITSVRDENQLKFSRADCHLLTSKEGALAPAIGAAIYAYHKKYDLNLSWDYWD